MVVRSVKTTKIGASCKEKETKKKRTPMRVGKCISEGSASEILVSKSKWRQEVQLYTVQRGWHDNPHKCDMESERIQENGG